MSVRVRYTLGVGGRLAGPPEENGSILAQVHQVLPALAPARPGGGWPAGFLRPGWQLGFWDSAAEIGGANNQETRIGFRAEVICRLDGTIYDAKQELVDTHFYEFCAYRDNVWHKDLKVRLEELNQDIAKQHGAEKLIEKIWFRQWEFFCGNGGDS